jgi:hydroxymethylpyrimidine pyrophosphatase-like HAD family hydrolase
MLKEIVTSDYWIIENEKMGAKWYFCKHEERLLKYLKRKQMGQLIFTTYLNIDYGPLINEYDNMVYIIKNKHTRFGDVETLRKEYFKTQREGNQITSFEDSNGNWYDSNVLNDTCPFRPDLTPLNKVYEELRELVKNHRDFWSAKVAVNNQLTTIEDFVKQ